MTREQWLTVGVVQGWLTPICLMHDFDHLLTTEEADLYNRDGEDPCIPRYLATGD